MTAFFLNYTEPTGIYPSWHTLSLHDALPILRPFALFGAAAAVLFAASVGLAWPVVAHFLETGLVPRIPTAALSTGMMTVAFLSRTEEHTPELQSLMRFSYVVHCSTKPNPSLYRAQLTSSHVYLSLLFL